MNIVKEKINEKEDLDFITYKRFIESISPNGYTVDKTRFGKEYDAIQTNKKTGERTFVEIKNRDEYAYEDFQTFMLSLHKLDSMQRMMKKENAQKGFVAGLYPKSKKVVLFDITNLTPTVADIKWLYVKKTQYDPNSPKEWQPKAALNLQQGNYKHYSTYVYDFDFVM